MRSQYIAGSCCIHIYFSENTILFFKLSKLFMTISICDINLNKFSSSS